MNRHPNKPVLPQVSSWLERRTFSFAEADKSLVFDAETRDWNEMFQRLQVLIPSLISFVNTL